MDPIATTNSWSSRRKAIYLWSTILVLTLISLLIFWKYWYRAPTCFDHLQNGDETGLDCGGSCSLVCSAEALAPVMRSDPRLFQIYPNIYSVISFVENRNIDSSAFGVPYKFKLYDTNGSTIYERDGVTDLPKNKTSAVFEGNILIPAASSSPTRVTFELSPSIAWIKDPTKAPDLEIKHSPILDAATTPRIQATIKNNSIDDYKNVEIVAVVLDGKDNAIAASRTFVDNLKKNDEQDIFFTWPKPFALTENICEKPERVVLAIDRSGSMASEGKSPPEPLTDVKDAAASFLSELKEGDKAGFVSFATTATNPPDSGLTEDFAALKSLVSNLSISTNGTQYTNIADAINASRQELVSDDNVNANKVIILLTDGIANKPTDPNGSKSEADDIAYAESRAMSEAVSAKNDGINIYSIGLGKDIHKDFLQTIASSSRNFYLAPTSADLKNIYKQISHSICKEVPARIELYSKID